MSLPYTELRSHLRRPIPTRAKLEEQYLCPAPIARSPVSEMIRQFAPDRKDVRSGFIILLELIGLLQLACFSLI